VDVTAEKWKGFCNHVKNNEEQQWATDAIQVIEIKKLMIYAELAGSKSLRVKAVQTCPKRWLTINGS